MSLLSVRVGLAVLIAVLGEHGQMVGNTMVGVSSGYDYGSDNVRTGYGIRPRLLHYHDLDG